jgi:hypothetical protein
MPDRFPGALRAHRDPGDLQADRDPGDLQADRDPGDLRAHRDPAGVPDVPATRGTSLQVRELPGLVRRRLRGDYTVDVWGADHDWLDAVALALRVAVRPSAEGLDRVPDDGPAVLVANRRIGIGEALALAIAVRRHNGRLLRLVGAPDLAPIGPMVRRIGAVHAQAAEIRSLLAAGELVAVPLSPQLRVHRAGTVRPELLVPAIELGVPVIPVAILGGELTGTWRIAVGRPVEAPPATRRRTLAAAELADRARAGVQVLLDDSFPTRWSLG